MAAGILFSRVAGLVRERVFAHYFGNSDAGDAFKAALKIPNFLQNLFGEGVLSASFIPVYAGLLAKGDDRESGRVAGVVASVLALITSLLVVAGITASPWMIDAIAPGFQGEKRELTIHLVQIFFPGTGLLVMSAWCLGVLNSHRKFFLSYAAPVLWNAAIIGALIAFRHDDQSHLAIKAAWGLVLGSALQFCIQLPTALSLIRHLKLSLDIRHGAVTTVVRNFFPVVVARGVVQVSAYIDAVLASLLPSGAVSALAYAQVIYLLPVSLFGMSVSAAELPSMSSAQGTAQEISDYLRRRLESGLRQIAFFIVPSVAAFLALGDVVIGALFQSGKFTSESTVYVWGVLAGSTVGLLASTLGRLYSSAFYSLKDTRTPLRFALVRVALTTFLGYLFGLKAPLWLGIDASWGTAGLTVSAGLAGWVEFYLLRRGMNARIGKTGLTLGHQAQLWTAALAGVTVASGVRWLLPVLHPILRAAFILAPYGVVYLGVAWMLGVPEVKSLGKRLQKKR
ncbi:MAG: murein biosynthesis integral membrane protein MurJ [Bdellovibrionales bacterium]|nr:murein biosynthesis integral membrane protein MurJ [Bdellovibrionales bacterium]